VTEITKTFAPSFRSIFLVKLRNFMKRGVWLYALGSLVIVVGVQILNGQPLVTDQTAGTFSILFLIAFAFALSAILFSSLLSAQSLKSDFTTVTFREHELLVKRNTGNPTAQNWDWIISTEETRKNYYLTAKIIPRYELVLSKSALSEEENKALKSWLARNVPRFRGYRPPGQPL
jgi:hypothetical protein